MKLSLHALLAPPPLQIGCPANRKRSPESGSPKDSVRGSYHELAPPRPRSLLKLASWGRKTWLRNRYGCSVMQGLLWKWLQLAIRDQWTSSVEQFQPILKRL